VDGGLCGDREEPTYQHSLKGRAMKELGENRAGGSKTGYHTSKSRSP